MPNSEEIRPSTGRDRKPLPLEWPAATGVLPGAAARAAARAGGCGRGRPGPGD